jgi:hypothetical protein
MVVDNDNVKELRQALDLFLQVPLQKRRNVRLGESKKQQPWLRLVTHAVIPLCSHSNLTSAF